MWKWHVNYHVTQWTDDIKSAQGMIKVFYFLILPLPALESSRCSPRSSTKCWNFTLGNAFVKILVGFLSVGMYLTESLASSTALWIKWYHTLMCSICEWNLLSFGSAIAPWLSQLISIIVGSIFWSSAKNTTQPQCLLHSVCLHDVLSLCTQQSNYILLLGAPCNCSLDKVEWIAQNQVMVGLTSPIWVTIPCC